MFKVLYNQIRIDICIKPVTPILIKTGREAFDPTRPDNEFVKTATSFGEVPYLPGSSLKGIIRSHAERILRTLNLEKSECDITRDNSCVEKKGDNKVPYKENCFACRTFGSTKLASRIRLTDAYPWRVGDDPEAMKKAAKDIITEPRTGNKIDRRKGIAAGGALFTSEVVTSGNFYSEITLRNYQLWQIALLSLVLRDINAGHQRIGASKSRGLGKVSINITDFDIYQFGCLRDGDNKIMGIGCVPDTKEYDLIPEDYIEVPEFIKAQQDSPVSACFRSASEPHESWSKLASMMVNSDNWKRLMERRKP
jgi:CRISPR-associated RAMP protein (TIGR02581 family)